jgi:hypothetical protein
VMTSASRLYRMSDLSSVGDDPVALLAQVRGRISGLVAEATDEGLGRTVQPLGITVRDVVGHLVEVAERIADGQPVDFSRACPLVPEASSSPSDAPVSELLARWDAVWPGVEGALRTDPAVATAVVVDAVTHEHDVRTALDVPGDRDDAAVVASLYSLAEQFSARVTEAGLPALRITVEQWGTIAGTGTALHCLVADRFELVRGLTGRRSADQIARWNWSEDPARYLSVLSAAGSLPTADVRERDPRVPQHLANLDLTH